jgi:hypothetical protein
VSDPSPRRFSVGMSAAQRDQLRVEAEWARSSGLFDEYLAALKEIEFRLTVEPSDWGESREWLPGLRVQLRCGTSRMVTVLYGVAADADEVFVKEYRINRKYRPQSPP